MQSGSLIFDALCFVIPANQHLPLFRDSLAAEPMERTQRRLPERVEQQHLRASCGTVTK